MRLPSGRIYCCKICNVDIAFADDCISKCFRGSKGAAYLFTSCVNVFASEKSREEHFTTGRHVVTDIFCTCCNQLLGWKYLVAFEKSQKYKEGKFILDKVSIVKHALWDTVNVPTGSAAGAGDDDNEPPIVVPVAAGNFVPAAFNVHNVAMPDDDGDAPEDDFVSASL